jgi:aminoglycoside phosphotransferase (APT) family kinase protein
VTLDLSEKKINSLKNLIVELIPDWSTKALENFNYLAGGFSNNNYSFCASNASGTQQFVLRATNAPQPYVDRRFEAHWYRRLPEGVGVKPLAFDITTGAMITPLVEGEILAEVYDGKFSTTDLVKYIGNLHEMMPEVEREYSVSELAKLYEVDVYQFPANDSAVLVPCHNDLNPWNVIVTEDGWRTLDWEFVGLNDVLFDLVALHQGLELPASELLELSRLLDKSADSRRVHTAQKKFWYREWAWAEFQLKIGNSKKEIVEQRLVAWQKLKQL